MFSKLNLRPTRQIGLYNGRRWMKISLPSPFRRLADYKIPFMFKERTR